MKSKPLVIAHRGYSNKFPENTILAFTKAVAARADMIELDIHLAKDGELMVTHDYILGRTVRGAGERALDELTGDELAALGVARLADVFSAVRGAIPINVEVKHETLKTPALRAHLTQALLTTLSGCDQLESTLVSSFDWQILAQLRVANSQLKLGLLNDTPERDLRWAEARPLQPYSYHPSVRHLSKGLVEQMHGEGLKVFPYTANSETQFAELRELGVDGIITNCVERLVKFLG